MLYFWKTSYQISQPPEQELHAGYLHNLNEEPRKSTYAAR